MPSSGRSGPRAARPTGEAGLSAIRGGRRLRSLDAFRGLTIPGMLLVNNTALDTATPVQLTHAGWKEGVHLADLVFPWFLLIVGIAIPYSIAARRDRGARVGALCRTVASRSASLVLLGWLVDPTIAHRPVIGLGVLQLIGLAYLAGALLYQLPTVVRWGVAASLLLGHWAALRFVPVPGIGAGALQEDADLVAYLNETYLRPLHVAGLVSAVPTTALVVIGSGIGDIVRGQADVRRRLRYLVLLGLILVAVGWFWSYDLPFSKALWTSSYILYAAGLGSLAFAALFLVSDLYPVSFLSFPLAVAGANAIFAYVAPILVKVFILQGWRWAASSGAAPTLQEALLGSLRHALGPIAGGWAYTACYLAAWWLVLLYLYRKRMYLRV